MGIFKETISDADDDVDIDVIIRGTSKSGASFPAIADIKTAR